MKPVRLLPMILGGLVDLIWPPTCAVCRDLLDAPWPNICPDCLGGAEALGKPQCPSCGQPGTTGKLCPVCQNQEPALQIRSAFSFEGAIAEAVSAFKFQGRSILAPALAELCRPGFEDLAAPGPDFLLPVPLHPARLRARGFNQSALLACALSRMTSVPVRLFDLIRIRPTTAQAQLANRKQREKNVSGAFAVRPRHALAKRHVCLIDDVVTSGATLTDCARALLTAGVTRVSAVTLARTLVQR